LHWIVLNDYFFTLAHFVYNTKRIYLTGCCFLSPKIDFKHAEAALVAFDLTGWIAMALFRL
jgi:hypothetical protein